MEEDNSVGDADNDATSAGVGVGGTGVSGTLTMLNGKSIV